MFIRKTIAATVLLLLLAATGWGGITPEQKDDLTTKLDALKSAIDAIAVDVPAPPPPPAALGTVTDLRVTSATGTTVTLTFTEVANGIGGAADYTLRYSAGVLAWGSAFGTEKLLAGVSAGAARSTTVSGLTPATAYQFQLVSYRGTLGAADVVFGALSNVAAATTVASTPPPGGLAALFPGDTGLETHPDVVFLERFDEPTTAGLFSRWSQVRNGAAMTFVPDVPAGSPVGRSLNIPWTGGGVSDGGHLFKLLVPGVDDTLYVRYYVKYPTTGKYQHEGVWVGGYNPPLSFPNPQAGLKPAGNDRFSASAEQTDDTLHFDHYNYFSNMHVSGDGHYWGNTLLNNPAVKVTEGTWACIEHMVRLNNPVTTSNGEHAIWINGVKVSHLGAGFPTGSWAGNNFTQAPTGTPFEGLRWRTDAALNINYLWLQNYSPNDPTGFSSSIKFAHMVAAKSYIGCLAP